VGTRTTRAGEEDAMTVQHRSSSLVVCAALVATIVSLAGQPGFADNAETMPHVRSSDQSIAGLIAQATNQSATLKRLIGRVDASNGIVYVEPGVCPQRVPACLKMWMLTLGSARFMRVVVDRRQLDSDSTLMGAVGHELQHALEALSEPSVTDSQKMFFFFRRYTPTMREQFETQAAVEAGDAVEDELRHWRSAAPSVDVTNARPF
jgi:hypothetical protein